MELTELTDIFTASTFKVFASVDSGGGTIKAINAKGAAALLSKEQLKKWEEWVKTEFGAKGLAYIKWRVGGEWESPIVKFFSRRPKRPRWPSAWISPKATCSSSAPTPGHEPSAKSWAVCACAARNCSASPPTAKDQLNFLWVVDFPLLAFSPEDNHWVAVHHPFTRPKAEDVPRLEAGDFGKVRAVAYDVVLNGVELGGGSIRIHERELQAKLFEVLGVNAEEQQQSSAISSRHSPSARPRTVAWRSASTASSCSSPGAESIREVIAFPKNNRGLDLMTHSPVEVDFKQLREIYIQSTAKKSQDAGQPAGVAAPLETQKKP